MFRLLRQPYPTEESVRRRLIKSVLIGLFVGLFLLAFQPFGLDDWETVNKAQKILGFGLVTLLVMLADSLFLPALFPRYFSDQDWTVGREILRTLALILVIAIGNRLYLAWIIEEGSAAYGWIPMIGMTFVVGIFPTVGAILLNYIVQLRKYSRVAAEFPDQSASSARKEPWLREQVTVVRMEDDPDTTLVLVAENEKDTVSLSARSLLFIESSDNYCTVVYHNSNPANSDKPLKPLLRSSLSRLEAQIAAKRNFRFHIVRCHRSYVVNLDRVERVTGNAQGYKLHLLGGQFQVPVARRFNDTLISQLKSLM
jgi:DNA-binding LytR/AlgR family response regulator